MRCRLVEDLSSSCFSGRLAPGGLAACWVACPAQVAWQTHRRYPDQHRFGRQWLCIITQSEKKLAQGLSAPQMFPMQTPHLDSSRDVSSGVPALP